uniref:Galectin n=1 Tax=Poecilia reticulata TaxID=8081 RepID=A0A3P9PY08_POERE
MEVKQKKANPSLNQPSRRRTSSFIVSVHLVASLNLLPSQPVPFSARIPGGMLPKRTVVIRGSVPHGAQSRTRDVAFHMNPRVKEGVVVRNARTGGQWGSEERQLSASPFAEGQYFDVSIRCGSQRFEVFVNEQHLFDFFHRTNFSEIDKLEIDGDVQISYVQL